MMGLILTARVCCVADGPKAASFSVMASSVSAVKPLPCACRAHCAADSPLFFFFFFNKMLLLV